jgi:hypothetical protein
METEYGGLRRSYCVRISVGQGSASIHTSGVFLKARFEIPACMEIWAKRRVFSLFLLVQLIYRQRLGVTAEKIKEWKRDE